MQKKKNVKTDWVKIKPEGIEKKVIELGKEGIAPEKIGTSLWGSRLRMNMLYGNHAQAAWVADSG